jgi:hypothetical protein
VRPVMAAEVEVEADRSVAEAIKEEVESSF